MPQPAAACDPHVAVLAFPFSTHAAPLLSIISRLASSAPHTHFSFFSTAESNNSLFSTHKHYFLPNVKAYNVSNGVPEDYVFVGKPQEDIELFLKAAPENLRKAVAEAEGVLFGNLQSVFSHMLHQMGLKLRCSKPPNYGLHFRISPESTTFSFPATMHVNFSWSRHCIFLVRLSEPLGLETLLFLFRQWPVNKEAFHN